MSLIEKSFLKWFGGIAAVLITAAVLGLMGMYSDSKLTKSNIDLNKSDMQELRQYHKDDVSLIRSRMDEIREDQKEIKQDIKLILKELK